jgi:uncharacterized protein YqhQ
MRGEREYVLGGQAVIEGVMMKGGKNYAVAVRSPSGNIVSETFSIKNGRLANVLKRTVLVRGLVILFSMLVIGFKALNYSAEVAIEEEEKGMSPLFVGITVLAAICLAILLFFFIPFVVGVGFSKVTGFSVGGFWFNLLEGVVRMGVFLLYIWGISFYRDLRRVFEYHGAEHKVVNAYEDRAILHADLVMGYSRFHPRCGTSFIIFLLLISIIVFSLVPANLSIVSKGVMRILLLPVIAGISYELIRMSGKKKKFLFFNIISAPGLWVQKITTREPDIDQVEVALASLDALSGNVT